MVRAMRQTPGIALLITGLLSTGPTLASAAAAPDAGAAAAEATATAPRKKLRLFNGKDLSGWKADVPDKDKDPNAPPSFVVRKGVLVSLGNPKGHLVSEARYRDYRLEVEYRFPGQPGNCGVLVHASKPRALYQMFPQSIEVQMKSGDAGDFWCIEENIVVPDMETRRPRKEGQVWGGGPKDARRIINLSDDAEKPLGQWNKLAIEARGNTLKVWVNGTLVNEGHDASASSGQIALQAEGTEVEFRRVDMSPLPPQAKAAK
jgi:hypothetical protein